MSSDMPTVTVGTTTIECDHGAVLRDVLQDHDLGINPHNGAASIINCRGHGTCGTCAVEIHRHEDNTENETQTSDESIASTDTEDSSDITTDTDTYAGSGSPDNQLSNEISTHISSHTAIERVRLTVPPHTSSSKLRLACQTRVYDDITVTKYDGLWGHHTDDD